MSDDSRFIPLPPEGLDRMPRMDASEGSYFTGNGPAPRPTVTIHRPDGWQPQALVNGEWVSVEEVRYEWQGDNPSEALKGWGVPNWITIRPDQDQ